jgi:rubrerythrin
MTRDHNWWEWWRAFLGFSHDERGRALAVLRHHYIEESQHITRFTQHAERMQYPQFKEQLQRIAAEKTAHVQWIGEKIKLLGGLLPSVPEPQLAGGNAWQSLLSDLEEQRRCAPELWDEIHRLRPEFPDIADVFQRIYDQGEIQRAEIRAMLMRSDPQALLAA